MFSADLSAGLIVFKGYVSCEGKYSAAVFNLELRDSDLFKFVWVEVRV